MTISRWSESDELFRNAGITWSNRPLIVVDDRRLVAPWCKTNIQWNAMAMTYPHCKSAFVWNKAKLKWKYWNITWPDITCFVEAAKVIKKGGGLDEWYEWQRRQEEEKRRRMVKVVCQVKGIKYTEEHYRSNSFISVSDVKLVLKEMGVDVFIDDVKVNI